MRILLYNFVQPNDPPHKQGGGVAVYQRNLARALEAAGHEVILLSSGDRYTLFGRTPHLACEAGPPRRAVIVNSPVFAPAHATFHRIRRVTDDPGLNHLPAELRARYGRLDVLHLQNVEGLTTGFLHGLRRAFPEARILFSAHNYNLVCPQVNLWFREQRACRDYRDGAACVNCLPGPDLSRFQRNARRMETLLGHLGITRRSPLLRPVRWLLRSPFMLRRRLQRLHGPASQAEAGPLVLSAPEKAVEYARYRTANIALCEDVFDKVLAVSDRTRAVLVARGVPADRIAVSPIGSTEAARFRMTRRITAARPGGLQIGFLGYMRADKGFWFLLDALEALPESMARALSVTIAAPIREGRAVERLRGMAHRFRAITLHDGYTHATLDRVLAGVELGIVPPLWEDNLPQVAIEMVARGIPILTSDRGGAREIAGRPDFTFAAGSRADFRRKLGAILSGQVPLARFWDGPIRILTMEEHLWALMAHYAPAADVPVASPEPETSAA